MVNGTLQDACETIECDKPSVNAPGYEPASYARMMAVNCTRTLFQCGIAADNVCWINKVADRLGVCVRPIPKIKTDSPLSVRGTGTRIR